MSRRDSRAGLTLPVVVRGGAVGAVAFLVGYLFSFLTAVGEVGRLARAYIPLAEAGGRFAPEWKLAGWAFYDAHLGRTVLPGQSFNMVSFAGVEYLYLVPPIVLLLAGAVAATVSGCERRREGLLAGGTVVAGYLPLVVVLVPLVRHVDVQPGFVRTLLLAGVLYPVLFGGVGGTLAAVVREE